MCQLFFDEESIYDISKLYLNKFCNGRMGGRTDAHTNKAKAICPFNFSKVGGILKHNDWLLADTCHMTQPIIARYFEFENEHKFL